MKIGSPLLMLKEKDLLGRPIPQYLEGKNLQTRISIVCQFSSNCSTKLLPERGDWIGLNVNNEYYSNEKNYIFTGTRMNT
jgi:hypothetical protein